MANQLNQLPTSLENIGTVNDDRRAVLVADVWYKFFTSLSQLLENFANGVLVFSTQSGSASGTTQGTAAPITAEWFVSDPTPANSGARLRSVVPGSYTTVFNQGVNPLRVYPPTGGRIDGLAVNAPYVLAADKMQVFYQTSPVQWLSQQLG